MFIECRHVLPSGERCKSRALRNDSFCYFHRNLRERIDGPPPRQGAAFIFPNIEDTRGLLLATIQTLRAMGFGQIKRNEAGTYLYGINIAARLVARIEQTDYDPIRALEYDNNCSELAEQSTGCEPLHDCVSCERQDICEVYETAKFDPNAPVAYKKLIAKAQKLTTNDAIAEWRMREKARKERMRRLRSLAVVETESEEDEFGPLPPAKTTTAAENDPAPNNDERQSNNDGLSIQAVAAAAPHPGAPSLRIKGGITLSKLHKPKNRTTRLGRCARGTPTLNPADSIKCQKLPGRGTHQQLTRVC